MVERMMAIKKFLQEEGGAVAVEYVILVAAAAILLTAGVVALFNSMGNLFDAWASYFGPTG
jgi:Flp pilus assembly pilin Flp